LLAYIVEIRKIFPSNQSAMNRFLMEDIKDDSLSKKEGFTKYFTDSFPASCLPFSVLPLPLSCIP
jgi:hypothetical protein